MNSDFRIGPQSIVDASGQMFGRFSTAPRRTNLLGAAYRGLPRWARWTRLKEWQAVQLSTPEWFMNLALFDAKLMSLVQVKIFDRVRGEKHVFERKLPPGQMRIADSLFHTKNVYDGAGALLCFDNQIEQGAMHVLFDLAEGKPEAGSGRGRPRISGRLSLDYNAGAPQVVSQPFAHGGMYSHKGMFPASGYLTLGDRRVQLDRASSLALLDDHKGYYPYVMRWDWLTSAQVGADGVARAFNLTRNQCAEPERFNENCVWEGDRVGALPAVNFERRKRGSTESWRITDAEGRVDVCFTPSVPGSVHVNAWVVESRYQGPFGHIEGHLAADGLPELKLSGWFGMGEDFYLRC